MLSPDQNPGIGNHQEMFCKAKRRFWKISQNSQENISAGVSFFNKNCSSKKEFLKISQYSQENNYADASF